MQDHEAERLQRTTGASLALIRRGVSAAALVLAVFGCAQQPTTTAEKPPVNLSGYSVAFKEGFAAGCDTARGKARRDDRRFQADEQYARGWDDGRSICSRR